MPKVLEKKGRLGFGGAAVAGDEGGYSFSGLAEEESIQLLKEAFHLGFRVFDTAPIYGFGESERRIGKAFKNCREKVFITSKSGVTWHDNRRVDMSNDPQITEKMLEQSLRDLDTDYIDLYMIHWPDPKVDICYPMEILAKAKLAGKIKSIGLCNTQWEDLERANQVDRVEVVQSQFNAFETEACSLFEKLQALQISFQSWGTLDKGILTGAVTKKRELSKDYEKGDCRKKAPWWDQTEVLKKVSRVEEIAPLVEELGHTLLEWALGYNLVLNEVDQVLVGARTCQQLEQVWKVSQNLPTRENLEKIQGEWKKV